MSFQTANSKWKLPWTVPALVLCLATAIVILQLNSTFPFHLVRALEASLARGVDSIDYRSVLFLNGFAHRSWSLDTLFYLIDSNSLATAPLLVAFWWAWFKTGEETARHREFLLSGIIGSFVAVCAARMLAIGLPFRERPLRNPLLHFQLPYNMRPERLLDWSSFPSDHGAVWFAIAMALFLVSRRAGVALFAYLCFTLALARVYLGIHYPTDILAGGLIGIAVVRLANYDAIRTAVTRRPLQWMQKSPQWFYASFFLVTYQMTDGFSSLHELTGLFRAVVSATMKLF